jgi:hypothetical protein
MTTAAEFTRAEFQQALARLARCPDALTVRDLAMLLAVRADLGENAIKARDAARRRREIQR